MQMKYCNALTVHSLTLILLYIWSYSFNGRKSIILTAESIYFLIAGSIFFFFLPVYRTKTGIRWHLNFQKHSTALSNVCRIVLSKNNTFSHFNGFQTSYQTVRSHNSVLHIKTNLYINTFHILIFLPYENLIFSGEEKKLCQKKTVSKKTNANDNQWECTIQ